MQEITTKYRRRGFYAETYTTERSHNHRDMSEGCCRQEEIEVLMRLAMPPRDAKGNLLPPDQRNLPKGSIRALRQGGPFELIDDHLGVIQRLVFQSSIAARMFLRTLRQPSTPTLRKIRRHQASGKGARHGK